MPRDSSDGVDWPRIIKRAALYAASRLPRYLWRGRVNGHPPGAEEVQDIVQDALHRALERRAEWTTPGGPDTDRLMRIIFSRISHRITSLSNLEENQNTSLDKMLEESPNSDELSAERPNVSAYGILSPSERQDDHVYHSEFIDKAILHLEGDKEAQDVFRRIWHDLVVPRELAQEMGVSVHKVYNIRRRIERKLCKILEELRSSPRGLGS